MLGPYVLDTHILGISSELRQISLIIILIKAELSLDLSDLKSRAAVSAYVICSGKL